MSLSHRLFHNAQMIQMNSRPFQEITQNTKKKREKIVCICERVIIRLRITTIWMIRIPVFPIPQNVLFACYARGHFYSYGLDDIRARIHTHIRSFKWDGITHPCHNFNGGLVNSPMALKWWAKLADVWARCPNIFWCHPPHFKVTRAENRRFETNFK